MVKIRDEILSNYISILAQEDKHLSLTQEQYEKLQQGEFSTSGLGSEWVPDLSPEKKEDLGYRYHPKEKVYRGPRREGDPLKGRYSKQPKKPEVNIETGESEWFTTQKLIETVKNDPIHATVDLKVHRSPSTDFNTMYVLANSLHEWLKSSGINPEPGTLLYNEIEYMIKRLNEKMEEKEKSIK